MNAKCDDCMFLSSDHRRDEMSGAYPGHWQGRFIWVPATEPSAAATPADRTQYRMFRKTFHVDEVPSRATLRITAGDKFVVYCNGIYLGRGPCRSLLPQWSFYDTFDLTPHIRQGKNTIAVMVFWHGAANCFCADQRAGLWAEADMFLKRGEIQRVYTGESWKTRESQGWDTTAPLVNFCQGLRVECYNAAADPDDWCVADFDDSQWDDSIVLSVYNRWELLENSSCWEYLEPRLTPALEERQVEPVSIVQTGYMRPSAEHSAEADVAERLAASEYSLDAATAVDIETLLAGEAKFCSSARGDPYIVIDIGRPYNAVPFFEIEATQGDVVEIAYTNELREDRCPGKDGVSRFAARYVATDGVQRWQTWNVATAFRYVMLVFRTGKASVTLKRSGCVAHIYPVNRTGSFECSDKTLTLLWQAAIETNLMHLQDTYIMDPVRERAYYILAGEMEQSHLCYYVSCGDLAATKTHFRLTQRTQLSCGKFPLMLPNDEHRGFRRDPRPFASASYATIPSYATFYSMAVVRRQMWFPSEGFIESQYLNLMRAAEWLERQTDENGLLFNTPPINWLDWTLYTKWNEMGLSGAMLGFNAMYVKFLGDLAWCAAKLGYTADEKRWQNRQDYVKQAIRERMWDENRGLFTDYYTEQGPAATYSEMLNALSLLAGVPDERQKERILENIKNPADDVTRVSPLYMFYVAEALCSCDEECYALEYMSRRYAPVLGHSDFPTLPEGWGDNEYEASFGFVSIHGGGGGVAFALSTRVLGVTPVEEGFKRFAFRPCIGHLEHASGVIPSPAGVIPVSWRREGEELTLTITVPENCQCEADVPNGYRSEHLPRELGPGEHTLTARKK